MTGDKIKKNEMGWACGTCEREERCTQGFGGQTLGKESLRRTTCKWEDNFKMDFQEGGQGNMDWINMAQDTVRWRAFVNALGDLRGVP